MANLVLGFPVYSDVGVVQTPVIAGGSWQGALPLANLQNRKLSKLARSTNAALASTRLHYDLGISRDVRLWALPKHTMSTAAKVRILATLQPLLFRYEAGDDISLLGGTFTRATPAPYVDRNGIVRTAASGELRDSHFIDGVRHVLLEPARTNVCIQSRNLTVTWGNVATTAFDAVGLDGTANSATTVTDDDPAAHENKTQVVTIPNDSNPVAVGFWIKKDSNETRFAQLGFSITGGTAKQIRASFNTATGAYVASNSVGGGGTIRITDYAEDWWLVEVIITNNSTGNTAANLVVYPAARTALAGSDDVAAVGSIVVGQVQVEVNSGFVTSPIFTTTVSVTRNADALSFAYTAVPQEMTVFFDAVDLGTSLSSSARFLEIGATSGTGARLYIQSYQLEARLRAFHFDAAAGNVNSYPTQVLAFGDRVEGRAVLDDDGSILAGVSVNGAAEVTAAESSALPFAPAWATQTITLNTAAGGGTGGSAAFRSVRIMAGTQSLATMQASVYDTGWLDGWPSGLDLEEADGINVPFVHVASAAQAHQLGSIQIDDSLNADGSVDLARLVVAGGFQPLSNMRYGAQLGLESDTIRSVTDGGAAVYQEKPVRRTKRFVLGNLDETDAFTKAWKIQRQAGLSKQVFFVSDPDDTTLMHERAFLGVLRQLGALEYAYADRHTMAFEIVEDL